MFLSNNNLLNKSQILTIPNNNNNSINLPFRQDTGLGASISSNNNYNINSTANQQNNCSLTTSNLVSPINSNHSNSNFVQNIPSCSTPVPQLQVSRKSISNRNLNNVNHNKNNLPPQFIKKENLDHK